MTHQSRKYGKGVRVRRVEAGERQARYDALTGPEKITLVMSRPGESKRELTRLFGQAKKKIAVRVDVATGTATAEVVKPTGKRHTPAPSKTQIKRAKRQAQS